MSWGKSGADRRPRRWPEAICREVLPCPCRLVSASPRDVSSRGLCSKENQACSEPSAGHKSVAAGAAQHKSPWEKVETESVKWSGCVSPPCPFPATSPAL